MSLSSNRMFTWHLAWGSGSVPHLVYMEWYRSIYEDAATVAEHLNGKPAGERVIFNNQFTSILAHPSDALPGGYRGPWFTNGIAAAKATWTTLINALYDAGAPVDMMVIDLEDNLYASEISEAQATAIGADARWTSQLVPLLGFSNPQLIRAASSVAGSHLKWNSVAKKIWGDAFAEALNEPLQAKYPGAFFTNYNFFDRDPDDTIPSQYNDYQYYEGGIPGTHQGLVLYGGTQTAWRSTAYGGLAQMINEVRSSYRAAPDTPMLPWLSVKSYQPNPSSAANDHVPYAGTKIWDEVHHHAKLSAALKAILLFNPCDDHSNIPAHNQWVLDNQAAEAVATNFDEQSHGDELLEPLFTANVSPDDAYFVSACRQQGGVIARVTLKGNTTETVTIDGQNFSVSRDSGEYGTWVYIPAPEEPEPPGEAAATRRRDNLMEYLYWNKPGRQS